MSDSFADLWSTTAPLPPKAKPQTLSSASASTSSSSASPAPPNKPYGGSKPDVFAMLSGSSTGTRYGGGYTGNGTSLAASAPGSRSMTPSGSSLSGASIMSKPGSASSRRTTPQPPGQAQPVGRATSADAFGDLFASPSAGTGAGMTLAARLALEAQQRGRASPAGGLNAPVVPATTTTVDSGAWAGLDALGGGLTATPPPIETVKVDDVDDWGLGDFGTAPTPANGSVTKNGRPEQQDDDILGVLGAPPRPVVPASTSRSTPRQQAPSPPPHVLGQIVQMGFSAEQAKAALSKTKDGADVPAALERLLAGANEPAAPAPALARKPATKAKTLWDMDEFSATPPTEPTRSQSDVPQASDTGHHEHHSKVASVDEPFDFGGREDRVDEARRHRPRQRGLLDLSDDDDDGHGDGLAGITQDHRRHHHHHRHHQHEDDILGALGAPPRSDAAAPTQHKRPPPAKATRAASPPPHILGQIVEMGFSVQQARAALAQTSTGLDVAAALDSLLGASSGTPPPPPTAPEPAPRARGAPKGQKERERERRERLLAGSGASGSGAGAQTPGVAELQEQADKLLAQASEIGLSVFSKASAMWGKGKERVVKAYEERAAPGAGAEAEAGSRRGRAMGRGRGDGRPKWMQEVPHVQEEHGAVGFRDEHGGFADEEEDHGAFREEKEKAKVVEKQREEPPALQYHEEEVDLFAPAPAPMRAMSSSSAPPAAAPAAQRRPAVSRHTSTVASCTRSTPTLTTAPAASIPDRVLPSASPAALATALKRKTAGTDAFKLGQYAAAGDSYTVALEALPVDHLLRVPLHTNRALARIKVGDSRGAEEDCARALGVVLGLGEEALLSEDDGAGSRPPGALVWSPASLPASLARADATGAWTHAQGYGTDLADGYVKALRRRAEAREARERWEPALRDWEVLAACAWAGEVPRREAARGRGRCRDMVEGAASGGAAAALKAAPAPASTRPKPKLRPAAPAGPSKALAALQSSNAAAEADDAARYALKDSVDARLLAWKGGKETNIRALLCSLDAVLWDGVLEGARVKGLHEVVSAAQVKRAYVRAVGRVHPDKLNASNATVEQRMLANAVFGTLNEAWIAFQAGQK